MQNNLIVAMIISIAMVACSSQKPKADNSVQEQQSLSTATIDTSKWYLSKIHSAPEVIEVTARKAFIRFNEEKGSAGGNGSCNSFGSTMKTDGANISFSNVFSTKMYCEGVQKIEDNFLDQLQKVTRFEIRGKDFFLFEKDKVLLEFNRD